MYVVYVIRVQQPQTLLFFFFLLSSIHAGLLRFKLMIVWADVSFSSEISCVLN